MRRKDIAIILRLVADSLYIFGFLLLVPLSIALATAEYVEALAFGLGAALLIPSLFFVRRRFTASGVTPYHAAVALALTWLALSMLSAIPFIAHGLPWLDALFESFSAWTDTGLTMIPQPETLSRALGFFRVLMQWVSGLGVVMFMLSLRGPTPRAAHSLFQAEGRFEDFTPNLWEVGRTIVLIYLGYTVAGAILLWIMGVPPFDALAHAITSLSTGGFSTNSVGVGGYGAWPSLVAMVLMLCGGISFGSHQALLSGDLRKFARNPEIRALFVIIVGALSLILLQQALVFGLGWTQMRPLENAFYVVTAITSCGAGTTPALGQMPEMVHFTLLFLMISGAVYGSTTGGLKLWRVIILKQIIGREVKRPFFPPDTVMPLRMGSHLITESLALQVAAYVVLYLTVGVMGSLAFKAFGYSALESLFIVFSAQGTVGLNIIPDAAYYGMPAGLKLLLVFHMLIGRVEILPIFYLLRGLRGETRVGMQGS